MYPIILQNITPPDAIIVRIKKTLILPEQPSETQQHLLVLTHIINGIHKIISNPNKTAITIKTGVGKY